MKTIRFFYRSFSFQDHSCTLTQKIPLAINRVSLSIAERIFPSDQGELGHSCGLIRRIGSESGLSFFRSWK